MCHVYIIRDSCFLFNQFGKYIVGENFMFEFKFTIVAREVDSAEDLAVMRAAIIERADEWDERTAAGDIDGRPSFIGVDSNGHNQYQVLAKNSGVTDYMTTQYQELSSRFTIPLIIDLKVEPNDS